jgi:hypothetical protein
MFTDAELRAGVRKQLAEIQDEYGSQALLHLFKRMIPKSWARAQILNCLVEYGLRDDRYVIATGRCRGEAVDFLSVYSEDWMKLVSCAVRPRGDLKALEALGFIKELGTRCLRLDHRKCTTIRINWLAVLVAVRDRKSGLEEYRSWSQDDECATIESGSSPGFKGKMRKDDL